MMVVRFAFSSERWPDRRVDTLYEEAAYFRMLFAERQADLDHYTRITTDIRTEILELGVGTGRVAIHLARQGRKVVGVDNAPAMLDICRADLVTESESTRARITLHEADVRTLQLGKRFERILCPFNGIAHFHTHETLSDFFQSVQNHITPEGEFCFDVMIPDFALLQGGASSVPRFRHPRTNEICRMEERYTFDASSQVLYIQTEIRALESETPTQSLSLRLRQFFPQELRLLIRHFGFDLYEESHVLGDSMTYRCRPTRRA